MIFQISRENFFDKWHLVSGSLPPIWILFALKRIKATIFVLAAALFVSFLLSPVHFFMPHGVLHFLLIAENIVNINLPKNSAKLFLKCYSIVWSFKKFSFAPIMLENLGNLLSEKLVNEVTAFFRNGGFFWKLSWIVEFRIKIAVFRFWEEGRCIKLVWIAKSCLKTDHRIVLTNISCQKTLD